MSAIFTKLTPEEITKFCAVNNCKEQQPFTTLGFYVPGMPFTIVTGILQKIDFRLMSLGRQGTLLKMTDRLGLSVITTNVQNLQMLLNNVEIAFKQCVQINLASPACFTRSQGFIECYIKG